MIKLIALLSGIITPVASIAPVVSTVQKNNILQEKSDDAKAEEKILYWNNNHSREIRRTTSFPATKNDSPELNSIWNFDLGTEKPNYKTLDFINANGISLKWGGDHLMWKWPTKVNLEFNDLNKVQIYGGKDPAFYDYVRKNKIVDHEYTDILAKCLVKTYFGYTWYQKDGHYYMQFLAWQVVLESNSFSKAYLTADFGLGISLK
ncbi:hypothetical protein ESOMN_v1c02420 [Williamsoniiplasma somnilux]|uniref:Uncharacterized protein n=1 Tax=Williamsoniiplasma somnilux TaxID=215578 RepID=A0A2K8NYJ7_9MOLU|nr:hypothetical protein [Williamsoniiplasma somnilux]ATZ18626.1 hypothetical protein ESOMN_v1c02420 [Williamsoniiplasma somnilux]